MEIIINGLEKAFSEKLKQARSIAGISQAKMSETLFIPLRTIESWESGSREPPSYVQSLVLNAIKDLL